MAPYKAKMDFGDILEKWDRRPGALKPGAGNGRDDVSARDNGAPDEKSGSAMRRRRLLKKEPDAVIDLHNLTREEARLALESFFRDSRERGFEKLQVIHGKGNHAGSEGVLRTLTREFIEECPFAGQSGYSFGAAGGSGATWVLLKNVNARGR